MRTINNQSRFNKSANSTITCQKSNKISDYKFKVGPLINEKIIEINPISLKSIPMTNSKTKESEYNNLLINKTKSSIVNKITTVSQSYNPFLSKNVVKESERNINIEDDLISNDDIFSYNKSKNLSFLSANNNKNNSNLSSTIKSDNCIRSRQSLIDNNSNSIVSFQSREDNDSSFQDDSRISSNSVDKIIMDDFLILEEKFAFIKTALRKTRNSAFLFEEWWNYFNYCELKYRMETTFENNNVMKDSKILETLAIIIIYDISFDDKFSSFAKNLYNLFCIVYQNFLIVIEYYIDKFSNRNKIFDHTINLIQEKLEIVLKPGENESLVRKNNNKIFNCIRDIIHIYNKKQITQNFAYFLSKMQNISIEEVNDYFKNHIKRKIEKTHALVPFDNLLYQPEKQIFPVPPFIKSKTRKCYTLILDLDETLIHLKIHKMDNMKGVITFRPGLFEFLEQMSMLYELIVFTCGTVQYAEPIIDEIDKKNSYFDYRLYRDHTSFLNGEYVKDLSLIGRDISKTLIVDNLPQNFRLQKENGIFIKSFYSDNMDDKSLYELIPILKIENKPEDVRIELLKYKNIIVRSVSTGLTNKHKDFSLK